MAESDKQPGASSGRPGGNTNSGVTPTNSRLSSGREILWLVKSGDRVIGPFLTAEVNRRLRSKELVVIDEVIAPQSRWRHIRDEPAFSSVVDEIRTGLMAARDDTEVGTSTGTPTITAREDRGRDADSIGNATQARFEESIRVSQIQDAEIVSESNDRDRTPVPGTRDGETTPNPAASARAKNANVHSSLAYAPPKSAQIGRDTTALVSKTSRVLWAVVTVALIVIVAAVYVTKVMPVRQAGDRAEEIGRLRREADRAWDRAEFLRALKLYEQINREPHTDLETDLRQAILMLRVERETLAAKRRIEELLPKFTGPELKTRARIALAVASLQSDEPLEAQKALVEIIKEPDAGPIAYFNLACAQAATGLRNDAIQSLKRLENHPTLEAPSRVLRAILHLKDGAARAAAADVEVANLATTAAWRQELLAVGAVADFIDGNRKRSLQRLRMALDTDPMQTAEFFVDPLVYLEPIRWRHWLSFVDDFALRMRTNSAKALHALALINADRRVEAQKLLTEELSTKMADGDLQAINAYNLMLQGREDESKGALKLARSEKGGPALILSAIIEARLCERQNDQNCADMIWASLNERGTHTVAAEVSVARVEGRISKEKGQQMAERLRTLYPTSVPVRTLSDEIAESKAEVKAEVKADAKADAKAEGRPGKGGSNRE